MIIMMTILMTVMTRVMVMVIVMTAEKPNCQQLHPNHHNFEDQDHDHGDNFACSSDHQDGDLYDFGDHNYGEDHNR